MIFLSCILKKNDITGDMLLLPVAESDSDEEEEEEEEEEEFDSEGEDGEDGGMSSQSSGRRYPSRSKNSRSTRLTRNSAGADRKRAGKHHSQLSPASRNPPANSLNILLRGSFSESRTEVNGHSSRSSRRERRPHQDSEGATSQGSEREEEEEITVRRSLKRKTARAAVNKIKLLEASDEDYEEEEEEEKEKPRKSSSRLRQPVRASKRTAVIQSSSESDEEPSTRGR